MEGVENKFVNPHLTKAGNPFPPTSALSDESSKTRRVLVPKVLEPLPHTRIIRSVAPTWTHGSGRAAGKEPVNRLFTRQPSPHRPPPTSFGGTLGFHRRMDPGHSSLKSFAPTPAPRTEDRLVTPHLSLSPALRPGEEGGRGTFDVLGPTSREDQGQWRDGRGRPMEEVVPEKPIFCPFRCHQVGGGAEPNGPGPRGTYTCTPRVGTTCGLHRTSRNEEALRAKS